jgi:hypothetical protein
MSVNLQNQFFTASDENNTYMNLNYIPPLGQLNQPSYLSLAGWSVDADKTLLNPIGFRSSVIHASNLYVDGFSPNMVIGTAASGKGYLKDNIYTDIPIECCQDDYLFMGFTLTNKQAALNYMKNIRVFIWDGNPATFPKSAQLMTYNFGLANTELVLNQSIGSIGNTTSAVLWSDGMFYIRMNYLWSELVNNSIYLAIVYEEADKMPKTRRLLTPYVRLTFRNNGKSVSSIALDKITLPNLKPTPPSWVVER